MDMTKDMLSAPVKPSSQAKAAATDSAARTIIASEATAREKKTARLRALRLEQEAIQEKAEPAAKSKKPAAARKR
ncbi:hypothetical protein [Shinella oryzae]|uniref:hypothetical protein n=1 Tax=Shinella oryzae TaxID=2871820 RepID=UPI001FF567FB|nr:hypothetical protein [Shinella oryzae]UPA24806.1 hypothetical protein K6301_00875 [Shinella oryzae]